MSLPLISPKKHAIADYLLTASLLVLPSALGLNKRAKRIYAAEGIGLLAYVALTDTQVAVKPVIPFRTHMKIDPFNIAHFTLQTFLKPFRKDKKALIFNVAFTIVAAAVVFMTDEGKENNP